MILKEFVSSIFQVTGRGLGEAVTLALSQREREGHNPRRPAEAPDLPQTFVARQAGMGYLAAVEAALAFA
jgi:hypothetical protein